MKNPPLGALDGFGNGLGYSFVLLVVAAVKVFGAGTFFGIQVMPESYPVKFSSSTTKLFIIIGIMFGSLGPSAKPSRGDENPLKHILLNL